MQCGDWRGYRSAKLTSGLLTFGTSTAPFLSWLCFFIWLMLLWAGCCFSELTVAFLRCLLLFLSWLLLFWADCCFFELTAAFLSWRLLFSADCCCTNELTVAVLSLLLLYKWADCCCSELTVVFLSWLLLFSADCCFFELTVAFLSWLLFSWADCCFSQLTVAFLSWLLLFWGDCCTLAALRSISCSFPSVPHQIPASRACAYEVTLSENVIYFPVPSRDVTNQTLPGRE